jgi:hypothetical protein
MKLGLGAVAAVLLAIAAFRRARGVLKPAPRRATARPATGTPSGQAPSAMATTAIVGVAVAALVGIVWVTLELFT